MAFFQHYIFTPLKYSLSGIRFALRDRAFRFEIVLGLLLLPLLIIKFWRNHSLLLLISIGYLSILTVEAINCAIEKVVDLVSPTQHSLAKQAKDIASAAVFFSLMNFMLILFFCFFK